MDASGGHQRHLGGIADAVSQKLKRIGLFDKISRHGNGRVNIATRGVLQSTAGGDGGHGVSRGQPQLKLAHTRAALSAVRRHHSGIKVNLDLSRRVSRLEGELLDLVRVLCDCVGCGSVGFTLLCANGTSRRLVALKRRTVDQLGCAVGGDHHHSQQ